MTLRRHRITDSPEAVDPIRSKIMRAVRRTDTGVELRVRKAAHALGLRFRLHRSDLPGTPDLVFPKLRTVIFVHGCFWHRHVGCPNASMPKTRIEFWNEKFNSNVARDIRVQTKLRQLGWRVVVVWECETSSASGLERCLKPLLRRAADA